MDKTQCVHVFEITRSRCLTCAGRNRACENMKNGEITMKTKMSLSAEMGMTRTAWCS